MRSYIFIFIFFCRSLFSYPETPQVPVPHQYPGCQIVDPYEWLENDADPAVEQWEQEQNDYSDRFLSQNPDLPTLLSRLNGIKTKTEYTYQVENTTMIVHVQHHQKDDQPVYYLQKEEDAPKIEFLNPNKMGIHTRIESLEFSPDGHFAAYAITKGGNEKPRIYLMNVKTMERIREPLLGHIQDNIVWHPNSKGFYYTAFPSEEYYYQQSVYYHKVGTSSDQDKLILKDPENIAWFYSLVDYEESLLIYRTSLTKKGLTLTECYTLPFHNSLAKPKLSWKDEPDKPVATTYKFNHTTFFLTCENAPNYKILKETFWGTSEFIPESKDLIVDFCQVGKFYAVTYLSHGHSIIKIFDRNGKYLREIPLPSLGTATLETSTENEANLIFDSLIHPTSLYTYNSTTNQLTFSYSRYKDVLTNVELEISLHFVQSLDGTKIPVFVAHRQNLRKNGNLPVLIRGYGGFSIPMEPGFYPHFIPWLEAGGVIAIPCLRGGGEYGQKWHLDGMREKKQNTFDDCIATAEWLISENYTNPGRLALRGESNGGLLVGAVITQRPDLFKAAVSKVALLDMLRYPLFPLGSLWTGEYGSPQNAREFPFLENYSPYHYPLDASAPYPAVFFIAGKNDLRVHPMHMRKMAAKMQCALPEGNPILYWCDPSSGHRPSSTNSNVQSSVKMFGFLMQQLNLKPLKESETPPAHRSLSIPQQTSMEKAQKGLQFNKLNKKRLTKLYP